MLDELQGELHEKLSRAHNLHESAKAVLPVVIGVPGHLKLRNDE